MAKIPNFQRDTFELSQERLKRATNTFTLENGNEIHLTEEGFAAMAEVDAMLNARDQILLAMSERLRPPLLFGPNQLKTGITAAQTQVRVYGSLSSIGTCQPHRAPFMGVDVATEDEEPKRRAVESREVEVKLLT